MDREVQDYIVPQPAALPEAQKSPLGQPLLRLLVLTEHFVPAKGGSITWMLNTKATGILSLFVCI